MATFIIGLAILIVGAAVYGRFCERIFRPAQSGLRQLRWLKLHRKRQTHGEHGSVFFKPSVILRSVCDEESRE